MYIELHYFIVIGFFAEREQIFIKDNEDKLPDRDVDLCHDTLH